MRELCWNEGEPVAVVLESDEERTERGCSKVRRSEARPTAGAGVRNVGGDGAKYVAQAGGEATDKVKGQRRQTP